VRRILLLVCLPIALLLAACGSDDDAAPATTTETTATTETIETTAVTDDDEPAAPTTVDTGAPAGDAPGAGAADEGLGDALLVADLDPGAEVPGPEVDGAEGRFESELVDGVLCVDAVVTGLQSAVVGAHVHDGEAGENGPVVIDVGVPSLIDGGVATWSDVCIEVDDTVIEALAAAPERHYVNVHTEQARDGAVRGQLAVASIFDRSLR
jgi:hypothetical protein